MHNCTYTFTVDRGGAKSRRNVINLEMNYNDKETSTIRVDDLTVLAAEGCITIPEVN